MPRAQSLMALGFRECLGHVGTNYQQKHLFIFYGSICVFYFHVPHHEKTRVNPYSHKGLRGGHVRALYVP